jgi:hypothetical protein
MFNKTFNLFCYLNDSCALEPKQGWFEILKALKGVTINVSNENKLEQSSSIVNM